MVTHHLRNLMIFNRIIRICESFRSIWIILILFHRISGLGGRGVGCMGWTMLFKRYRFSIFATYFLYVCIFVYFYVNSYPYIYEHTHTHTTQPRTGRVLCMFNAHCRHNTWYVWYIYMRMLSKRPQIQTYCRYILCVDYNISFPTFLASILPRNVKLWDVPTAQNPTHKTTKICVDK